MAKATKAAKAKRPVVEAPSDEQITDAEIKEAILTKLSVPLWPHTGRALGVRRSATYTAAKEGRIPTLGDITSSKDVPTSWLRQKLGIESAA